MADRIAHFVAEKVLRPILDRAIAGEFQRRRLRFAVLYFTKVNSGIGGAKLLLCDSTLDAPEETFAVAFDKNPNLGARPRHPSKRRRSSSLRGRMEMRLGSLRRIRTELGGVL